MQNIFLSISKKIILKMLNFFPFLFSQNESPTFEIFEYDKPKLWKEVLPKKSGCITN